MPSDSQVSSVIYCDWAVAWNIGLRSSEEAGAVSTAAKPPLKPSPPHVLGRAGFLVSGSGLSVNLYTNIVLSLRMLEHLHSVFWNSLYDDVFLESYTAFVVSIHENAVAAGNIA
jgi:hypothetical protein